LILISILIIISPLLPFTSFYILPFFFSTSRAITSF
jgi:hypothetical protein